MEDYRNFAASFVQSVCLMTVFAPDSGMTCTVSSFSSISSTDERSIFSVSLSKKSKMGSSIDLNSRVKITLLSSLQESAARHFANHRIPVESFNLSEIQDSSVGVIEGNLIDTLIIHESILCFIESTGILHLSPHLTPLLYHKRAYNLSGD